MDAGTITMETDVQSEQTGGEKKGKGLTGSTLKLIAIGAMFIDHFAAIVLDRYLIASGFLNIITDPAQLSQPENKPLLIIYMIDMIMRLIGRLGFPIFCFLLVEGFGYTRSKVKYASRLALFALISEIPFDLALHDQVLEFTYQNVFFTLLIGMLTIWGIDTFWKRTDEKIKGKGGMFLQLLGIAAITAVGMAIAELLRTDYAALGIGTIVVMFLARKNYKAWLVIMSAVAAESMLQFYGLTNMEGWIFGGILWIVLLVIFLVACRKPGNGRAMAAGCGILTIGNPIEFTAFATVPLVANYNGKRGLKLKYFFYLFYPLHILLWYLVCVWLGV